MSNLKEELQEDVLSENGLTMKEEAFLEALFTSCNGDVRSAMDEAGFPKNMPTSIVTKRLKTEIQERTKDFLTASSARAAIVLNNILIDPNQPGSKNAIAAARDIMDRGGVYKEEGIKVTEVRNMFILPAKEKGEPLTIEHEDE